jgi:uncharacterized protein
VLRVVLDPGVLVSAVLATGGPPAEIVDRWREGEFDVIVSPKLLDELEGVLLRPRFRTAVDESTARTFVTALSAEALFVEDPDDPPAVTPDPNDDYLMALASTARADAVVSGDAHLTGMVAPEPPVLTPRQLLGRLDELPSI